MVSDDQRSVTDHSLPAPIDAAALRCIMSHHETKALRLRLLRAGFNYKGVRMTETCPQCKNQRVAIGRLIASRGPVVFRPGKLRPFTFTLLGGVEPSVPEFNACLDCGFLWGQINHLKLERFIRKHCAEETRRNCGVSDYGT
jgi:hypothetical protein